MYKLKKQTLAMMFILLVFMVGCSREETPKNYALKNQPNFNSLAKEFDKISKLGLSYDTSAEHLEKFLSISDSISKKLPKAIESKTTAKVDPAIEELDKNYSLFLKDTKELVSESSIIKVVILKNYLEVTNKIEDFTQDLNGADNQKLIKVEETLSSAWTKARDNIKQLNNQNNDVKTALNFTNNIIKDLENNIAALKSNQEPIKSLGIINNKAIEHISSLKENVKRNQIFVITYLQGLIKTIESKWPNQ